MALRISAGESYGNEKVFSYSVFGLRNDTTNTRHEAQRDIVGQRDSPWHESNVATYHVRKQRCGRKETEIQCVEGDFKRKRTSPEARVSEGLGCTVVGQRFQTFHSTWCV